MIVITILEKEFDKFNSLFTVVMCMWEGVEKISY